MRKNADKEMEYTFRTKFKGEIVAEFVKPKRKSRRAIILLGGMPSVPSKDEVLFFRVPKFMADSQVHLTGGIMVWF